MDQVCVCVGRIRSYTADLRRTAAPLGLAATGWCDLLPLGLLGWQREPCAETPLHPADRKWDSCTRIPSQGVVRVYFSGKAISRQP